MSDAMKIFEVNFYTKKDFKPLHKEIITARQSFGILLAGKVKAKSKGFTFDNNQHVATYKEV